MSLLENINDKNKFKIKFEVKYIYLFLLIIIIFGFIIFKYIYYDRKITFGIVEIMAYFTGSVAILTLLYHAFSLESSHKFHEEDLKLKKHQYSYEIISKINEPEMAETLQVMYEINKNKDLYFKENNIKEFENFLSSNSDKRAKLIMLINYFEHISILVCNKHVEENIIKDGFKSVFINTYTLLKLYIDKEQETNRKTWIKFEGLAKEWAKEK